MVVCRLAAVLAEAVLAVLVVHLGQDLVTDLRSVEKLVELVERVRAILLLLDLVRAAHTVLLVVAMLLVVD